MSFDAPSATTIAPAINVCKPLVLPSASSLCQPRANITMFSHKVVNLMQFSYELLILSYKSRLFHHLAMQEPLVSSHLTLLLLRRIVVEQSSIRGYVAKDPLLQHLGFNLVPSILFFLLSLPSHLCLFHHYVVVSIALGIARS